jgi:hypothetical protein
LQALRRVRAARVVETPAPQVLFLRRSLQAQQRGPVEQARLAALQAVLEPAALRARRERQLFRRL